MADVVVEVEPFSPTFDENVLIPTHQSDPHKLALQQNLLGLFIAAIVMIFMLLFGNVFVRPFDITDKDISYSLRPEIVAYWIVLVVGFLLPPAAIWACLFKENRSKFDIFSRISFYLFGGALTVVITEFLKLSVGRLRPDFLDRCKPDLVSLICTGTEKLVNDGRKSFPSGHASTSLYIGMFLIFWLWRVPKVGKIVKSPIGIMMLLGVFCASVYVAISRIQQFVHHPTDVLAGSFIGLVVAYFVVDLAVISEREKDE
jgi:diacylglycerol diphosphate phosphatase / phosphatidate phosphatase